MRDDIAAATTPHANRPIAPPTPMALAALGRLPAQLIRLAVRHVVQPLLHHMRVSGAAPADDPDRSVSVSPDGEPDTQARSALALQQEAARVNAILRSIADGVVVSDKRGRIVLMNAAARSMLARTPQAEKSLMAQLEKWQGGSEEAAAVRTHRLELADRVVSVRTAPVLTDEGDAMGSVLVMRDVTREVAAERLRDDFLNHISHELRTPLTVIKGYSDISKLGSGRMQAAVYEKAMEAIFAHAASLERMITQLIDLSEMATGTLRLDTRLINLRRFVQHSLEEWDERLRRAGLKAHMRHAGPEDLTVHADEARLRWAFDAILENACRYCPQGGDLEVTLSQLESTAAIQIRDQGVGISGDDLPHVFKRFYRGRPVDAEGNLLDLRGLGQGLYVVKSVIEAHGGRVWVESEVGKGSVFSLLLPLSEEMP